jgi:hypothetical protein
MAVAIKHTRGTAAAAAAWNGILPDGVLALEEDTGYIKFGDGSTVYNSLPYFGINAPDNLTFKNGKGVRSPSGLGGMYFDSSGNIRFDTGPGAAIILQDATESYDATRWYINNGVGGGSLNNLWKVFTTIQTTTARAGMIFFDNNNGTYPMGISYRWDGSSPSYSFNNRVGFCDDTGTPVFEVDDMCHAFGTQMQLTGQLSVIKMPNSGEITVTPQGTTGATTYSYKATGVLEDGTETEAVEVGTTTIGHATLDGTNFNRITFGPGFIENWFNPFKTYRIYRTAGGATQGLIIESDIGATAPFRFDDTGLVADTGIQPPTVNNTGGIRLEGLLRGIEQEAAPAAPDANGWVIYAVDNGAGKTQLYVKFATGAAQLIAAQP